MALSSYELKCVRTALGCTQETADQLGVVFDNYSQIDWSESTYGELRKEAKRVARCAGITILKDPSVPPPPRWD